VNPTRPTDAPPPQATSPPGGGEPLPLSLLNDYLYCPRRAALKLVEGWRAANQHTVRGDIVHEHADFAGYEVAKGVLLLRALPVWSDRLGLTGKCDIVEVEGASADLKSEISDLKSSVATLRPIEFKVGKRRQWENDDVQLCAQALCLEEMFARPIPRGAVYHADSKRRREVEFTPALRKRTEETVAALCALILTGQVPRPEYREACEHCSLHDICVPETSLRAPVIKRALTALFEI